MMDAEAGCHAADIQKDFANFQTKKTKNPMRCVLADGKEIQSKGMIEVEAVIDNETHMIPFEHLPVECPIISVKKIVKKKICVTVRDGGGYILKASSSSIFWSIARRGRRVLPGLDLRNRLHSQSNRSTALFRC